MNPGELLDSSTARSLDFRWLQHALAPASPYGERLYEGIRPFVPGEEQAANARAKRIAAIAAAYDDRRLDAMREIFRSVADAASAIARASMNDVLSDANFLELQRFFDGCIRYDALAQEAAVLPTAANDAVRACARDLERGRAGKFGFYLDDAYDGELAHARSALSSAQAEYDAVRGRAAACVASALGREISGTEFIVMRADLPDGLPAAVRVVREAPTYWLCEIDADEATLAALERRDALSATVAQAEERVRVALTDCIRTHAAALNDALDAFGTADILVAAARFTRAYGCSPAEIVPEPVLEFCDGRFVPLALELEREGRGFTPISVALHDVAVLTGPNMGGKSVCLRTCGFIAMCAAFGVPVPASSTRSALFTEIAWLGAGSETAGGLLSSFAQEVVRLRDLLQRARRPIFVMLDEFARTTTPHEGRALLVAVMRRFGVIGACGMAATHLASVAGAANARHFAVRGLRAIPSRVTDDLATALETLAASMDYTIEEVTADATAGSDAIALAALLGLDKRIIDDAYLAIEKK